jgi:hypothetical protein
MIKVIVLVLGVIGVVSSYDFSDTDFNKILLDDLIEFDAFADEDSPVLSQTQARSRRESPTPEIPPPPPKEQPPKCKPPGGGPKHNRCCNDGYEHSTEMKELKRQCFSEVKKARKAKHHGMHEDFDVFSCEKVERAKEKVLCAMECVSRKQGMVDDLGQPDEKKIKEVMRSYFKADAWQHGEIDNIVDICMGEVALKLTLAKQNSTTDNTVPKCSPAASIFTHCMWRQLNLKCPAELQDLSPNCQRIREKHIKKDANISAKLPTTTENAPEPPKLVTE